MNADPSVRTDGRCAQCGKPRNLTVKKSATNRLAAELLPLDPFCSTECCRAFHGCETKSSYHTGGVWDDPETAAATRERQREMRERSYRRYKAKAAVLFT